MGRNNRKYAIEFKIEAVSLVLDKKMSVKGAATDLGIDHGELRQWIKKSKDGTLTGGPKRAASTEELIRENKALRRQNVILQEEREILKKAAAFFARESR